MFGVLAVSTSLAAAPTPARTGDLLDRLTVYLDGAFYRVDVNRITIPDSDVPPSEARETFTERSIRISCIAGCSATAATFEDISQDMIISVFPVADGNPDIATIWTGGSTYWVRIYHLTRQKISRVMDAASKTYPQFAFADDDEGSPIVVMDGVEPPGKRGRVLLSGDIWKWDGERYALKPGFTRGLKPR